MKIDLHTDPSAHLVSSYSRDELFIAGERYTTTVAVTATGVHDLNLPDRYELLSLDGLKRVLALDTDIVVLGTGDRAEFCSPEHLAYANRAGTGLEAMATPAAARSYNVLVAENRSVAAVFFPPFDRD